MTSMTPAATRVERSSPLIAAGRDELFARVRRFCRMLRAAGFGVTPGRLIDVQRALLRVDLLDPGAVRWAFRVNLVSSREEEILFDRLFDAFWLHAAELQEVPSELELEPRPDDDNEEYPESPPDELGSPTHWSADEVARDLDLAVRWEDPTRSVERLVRELARRLATRPSRRREPARRGRRIDLRRSLRRNVRHGMDLVDLRRSRARVRKTRLVLLCDVSGSMDTYSPFLLQLMLGLQKALKSSRTVVFSTEATEITPSLRRQGVGETLREISRQARHWSGGTDIGGALARVNRTILRQGSPSSTVAIVLSDGYDQGDAAGIDAEMRALRRRVRTVVWVNPLIGTDGYAPVAKGMSAALPYVDHFLPAHDIESLYGLCDSLARI